MFRSVPVSIALAIAVPASAESWKVEPGAGNNAMAAVFDAPLGERINAVSSQVGCDLTYDPATRSIGGTCTVPLTSIQVDGDETKTGHFQQWATNKKSAPAACRLEARLTGVQLQEALAPEKAVRFAADVPFTICGRARTDGGKERVEGTAMLFPAGSYGTAPTVRIRARIERLNRDRYLVGPRHTDGWLARVQSLAKVVAEEGAVDLSLFAKVQAAQAAGK